MKEVIVGAASREFDWKRPKKFDWTTVNTQIEERLSTLLRDLSAKILGTSEAAVAFSNIITRVLTDYGVIKERPNGNHRPRRMEQVVSSLAIMKKKARMNIRNAPGEFLNIMRLHNKALNDKKRQEEKLSALKQERAFWKNRWKFTKSVLEDNGKEPAFPAAAAHEFFSTSFGSSSDLYSSLPAWVQEVMPSPFKRILTPHQSPLS